MGVTESLLLLLLHVKPRGFLRKLYNLQRYKICLNNSSVNQFFIFFLLQGNNKATTCVLHCSNTLIFRIPGQPRFFDFIFSWSHYLITLPGTGNHVVLHFQFEKLLSKHCVACIEFHGQIVYCKFRISADSIQ